MNLNDIYELSRLAESLPPFTNGGMFPPSRYYRFLYQLALYKRPNLSVELGVCGGGGSFNLLQGWTGRVVGIDHANDYPTHIEFLKQAPNYTFLLGDSIDLSTEVYNMYGKADIIFIDTVHNYSQTIREFEAWHPYMADDCIVILDDLFRDGMQEAWQYLIQIYGLGVRLDNLHMSGSPTDGGFGCIYNIKPYRTIP